MLDYGIWYRKQFLAEYVVEKRQKLQAYWILAIAALYFSAHIAYYLLKTI